MTLTRAIALFAKAAEPGRVKTRLVPPLRPAEAAALARAFLLDTTAKIRRVAERAGARAVIVFTPREAETWFHDLLGDAVELQPQSEGDLTGRLSAAYLALAAAGVPTVCFVGADSPTLPEAYIEAAFAALADGADVVVGPADDGGYYLIGLAAPHVGIFEGIAWSTPLVLAQTRYAADRLRLRLALLPSWYDVDDAPSLQRLIDEVQPAVPALAGPAAAPFTQAFLRARRT